MRNNIYCNYEFVLNGKIYEKMNVYIGETIDALEDLVKDIENYKISAICHAFDIGIDEFEVRKEEFENVKFVCLEIYFD